MKLFAGLRTIALLRRIAKALEAGNQLAQERMALEFPDYARKQPKARKVRQTEITQPTIDEWNQAYRERHGE
jgi:hypothetical protein